MGVNKYVISALMYIATSVLGSEQVKAREASAGLVAILKDVSKKENGTQCVDLLCSGNLYTATAKLDGQPYFIQFIQQAPYYEAGDYDEGISRLDIYKCNNDITVPEKFNAVTPIESCDPNRNWSDYQANGNPSCYDFKTGKEKGIKCSIFKKQVNNTYARLAQRLGVILSGKTKK